MMHLQVEGDVIQGQAIMKFAANHPLQFDDPKIAWCVGFMQFITSLMAEVCCLFYISTINNTLDVIIKFMAISKISKVGELYSNSMPNDNKLKFKAKKNSPEKEEKVDKPEDKKPEDKKTEDKDVKKTKEEEYDGLFTK
jgi:hypothetical protein